MRVVLSFLILLPMALSAKTLISVSGYGYKEESYITKAYFKTESFSDSIATSNGVEYFREKEDEKIRTKIKGFVSANYLLGSSKPKYAAFTQIASIEKREENRKATFYTGFGLSAFVEDFNMGYKILYYGTDNHKPFKESLRHAILLKFRINSITFDGSFMAATKNTMDYIVDAKIAYIHELFEGLDLKAEFYYFSKSYSSTKDIGLLFGIDINFS